MIRNRYAEAITEDATTDNDATPLLHLRWGENGCDQQVAYKFTRHEIRQFRGTTAHFVEAWRDRLAEHVPEWAIPVACAGLTELVDAVRAA